MEQITITLNQIKAHNPCKDGLEKVLKANGGTKADMDKPFPVSSILESNDLDDTLWVLRCLPEYDNLWRKYAWWCAKQVSHMTDDKRVHDCIDVVWRYSEGQATEQELNTARGSARGSAWAAASSAAWSAAISAAWSAWSAARAADEAAARDAQKQKLKEILDTGEFVL